MIQSVDLANVQASFKDSTYTVHETGLAMIRTEDLVMGRPWRVFRWHRGQAHYSGWYWSATMARHVVYESRLELARLLLADFDPQVCWIAAQPFRVTGPSGDRTRRHVPDFLLVDRDGLVTVVNVKPTQQLCDPQVAEALAWAEKLFGERGWQHEIFSGTHVELLGNVRFLAAYRHANRVDAESVAQVERMVVEPTRLGDLLAVRPQQAAEVRAAALHLLWRGVFRADLSIPLSASTVVERAA
jgi:hypothetical protein